jgi:hypothetical protein
MALDSTAHHHAARRAHERAFDLDVVRFDAFNPALSPPGTMSAPVHLLRARMALP